MTPFTFAACLSLAPGLALQDEDDEDRNPEVTALIQKLSPEGPAGRIVKLSASEAGFRAVEEAIHQALSWKTRSLHADPLSHYETHLFHRDAEGGLSLKGERRGEVDALRRRAARMKALFEDFSRRLDGKGAAAPADPAVRHALFRLFARICGGEEADSLDFILDALRPGADGKLRVAEERAEETTEVLAELSELGDELGDAEAEWLALLEKADAAAKEALGGDFAKRFMASRIAHAEEEDDDGNARPRLLQVLAALGTDDIKPDWAKIRREIDRGAAMHREIGAELDRVAGALAPEDADVRDRLKEPTLRILLAEREAARRTGAMAELEELLAEEEGPEELAGEFRELQAAYADLAERLADSATAEIFGSPTAIPAIERHVDEVIGSLLDRMLEDAVPAFARRYLTEKDGRYHWKPERAYKVEEIERRAQEIEREESDDE